MDTTFSQYRARGNIPSTLTEALRRIAAAGWTASEHSIVRSDGSVYAFSREVAGRLGFPAFTCEFRYGQYWESGARR